MNAETKTCTKCGLEKSIAEFRTFFAKHRNKHYIRHDCKVCENAASNARNMHRYATDSVFKQERKQYAEQHRRKKGIPKKLKIYDSPAECSKAFFKKNPEKRALYNKKAYERLKLSGSDIIIRRRKEYVERVKQNPKRLSNMREYYKKRAKKQRDQVSDNYIKLLLTLDKTITRKTIPQELVEIKRKQLQMKRLLKA